MATKREQILQAIEAALAGTVQVGTRIYRSRVTPLARGESPAIVVEPGRDDPQQNTSLPTLDWTFNVRVIVIVRGEVPDQVADPIIEDLHAKLMADLSLGGVAMDIQPATVIFELIEADQPAGAITCNFVVRYRTAVSSLSAG